MPASVKDTDRDSKYYWNTTGWPYSVSQQKQDTEDSCDLSKKILEHLSAVVFSLTVLSLGWLACGVIVFLKNGSILMPTVFSVIALLFAFVVLEISLYPSYVLLSIITKDKNKKQEE